MSDLEHDVGAYARLSALLSQAIVPEDRARLLGAHGLNEARWEALDEAWQARLSDCDSSCDMIEGQNIPPLLAAYAQAFAAAQQENFLNRQPLSFERYLEIAKALKQGKSPASVLAQRQATFEEFLQAHRHWVEQALHDSELAQRIRKALE